MPATLSFYPMTVRLFSPFAATYRKLDLQKTWWHRLAFVGLLLCVMAAFALTLVLTIGPDIDAHKTATETTAAAQARNERYPWEQYAQITSLPPLPKGYSAVVMLSGQGDRIQFPADTTRGEMMKALCEHLKQGDEACWQVVSESPASSTAADHTGSGIAKEPGFWRLIIRDIGIALAVSLAINYLLQLAYRAVIFVVFGKPEAPAVASL